MQTSKQRRHKRHPIRIPISLCKGDLMIRESAYAADLSVGGVFIETSNYTLDRNEKVFLEIDTVDGGKVRLMGTVMWSNLFPVGRDVRHEQRKGVGVRFHGSTEQELERWLDLLTVSPN